MLRGNELNNFSKNSLLIEFIKYVSMNSISMIGISCFILADTYFISKDLGAQGLAALNIAIPIYSFIHGSSLMVAIGGSTIFSISKASGDIYTRDRSFYVVIKSFLFFTLVFILLGLIFSKEISLLFGANDSIFGMANVYIKSMLLLSPCFMLNDIMNCFVRNDSNPRLSMIGMLFASFINIILDYIFIFPLGMGILGAGIATGLSPLVSIFILSTHFFTDKNSIHLVIGKNKKILGDENISGLLDESFEKKKIRGQENIIFKIIRIGIPSLVTEVAAAVVMITFNIVILNKGGNVGLAAYGIVLNIALVASSIFNGLAQGMQPLTSRAFGEKNLMNMKLFFSYSIKTSFLIAIILYILLFLFTNQVVAIFNSQGNPILQKIATTGARLYFISFFFSGINIVMSMFFASIDSSLEAQVITFLRGFIVVLPMIFLLSYLIGLIGIWMSLPISEAIVTLVGIYLIRKRNLNFVL